MDGKKWIYWTGIIAHWLNEQFELNEILLCLEPMPYPHTSRAIREFLTCKVQDFNLQNKVLCVVTDNGSNMVAAIRDWDGIERLPCTAHTLQLSVNRALKRNHRQIHRIQKLVKFFDSAKQSQRLDAAQIEVYNQKRRNDVHSRDQILSDDSDYDENSEGVEDEVATNYPIDKFIPTLKNVKDVPTRWNSKYRSWKRLIELKPAIKWLSATLPFRDDPDARKDGRKLQQLVLREEEWNFVQKLLKLLEPFDSATEYFSAGRYPTIAFIHPLMEAMKFHYAQSANINRNDHANEGQ